MFVVAVLTFLFFCGIQDRSVEKVAVLLADPRGETTPIFTFRTRVAAGNSQRGVLPALFVPV